MNWIRKQPVHLFVFAALTLGLAPFVPMPHVWEKLLMLFAGELVKPIDVFDFLMHGAPWALLLIRLVAGPLDSEEPGR